MMTTSSTLSRPARTDLSALKFNQVTVVVVTALAVLLTLPALTLLLGAAMLVGADVAARLVDRPAETPVGILVAAVGAPFFVLIARRSR